MCNDADANDPVADDPQLVAQGYTYRIKHDGIWLIKCDLVFA